MKAHDDIIGAITTDVRTYGLLVPDGSHLSSLRFSHKSFYEYIIAEFAANLLTGSNKEYCSKIETATRIRLNTIMSSPESLSYIGQIISKEIPSINNYDKQLHKLLKMIVFKHIYIIPPFLRIQFLLFALWFISISSVVKIWHFTVIFIVLHWVLRIKLGEPYISISNHPLTVFSFIGFIFLFHYLNTKIALILTNRINLWYIIQKTIIPLKQIKSNFFRKLIQGLDEKTLRGIAAQIRHESFFW